MAQSRATILHHEAGKYYFFYLPRQSGFEFTQWHSSKFSVTAESLNYLRKPRNATFELQPVLEFNCAEQYMMYAKAIYFNDPETGKKIMGASEPRAQKKLGREVKGFNDRTWAEVREKVVEEANWAKFTQNDELKEVMLASGDKTLVEASPTDRIWGIGYREKDAMGNQASWGQNLLGKCLMRVRERIREADE
jgi:ribA/ribD-fused uncharacterized protein